MRQAVRYGLKEIRVEDLPAPTLRANHVLVGVQASLISSGTETASIKTKGVAHELRENPSHIEKILKVMQATSPLLTIAEVRAKFEELVVLGYAGAGTVLAVHPTVKDVRVGDRVAYGGEGTGHGEVVLAARNLLTPIPASLTYEDAAFATLGAIATNAVRAASLSLGDRVVVIGLGLVGQLVAQIARAEGARVIGVDLQAERIALAKRLGVEHGLVSDASVVENVKSLTDGRGADAVFIAAASKSSVPAQTGMRMCRDRGAMIVVGAVGLDLPWHEMYMKELKLFMARAYGPGSYDEAYERQGRDYPFAYVRWTENRNMGAFLDAVADGRIAVQPLITNRYALDDAPEAYRSIIESPSSTLAVMVQYPALDPVASDHSALLRTKVPVQTAAPAITPVKGDVRLALVGAGNIAKWAHLPVIRKVPGASLRAVQSGTAARTVSYARRFGAAYATSSFQEVLDDAEVDAVLITSRNPQHASQAVASLKAGKHCFVEKPVALTREECDALREASQVSGCIAVTGFNRRFAPDYVALHAAARRASGPLAIQCTVTSPGISGDYWMADPAIGGAILGEACHFVDVIAWVGGARIRSVSAMSLPEEMVGGQGSNTLSVTFALENGNVGSLLYSTLGNAAETGERTIVLGSGLRAETENFRKLWIRGAGQKVSTTRFFADKGYKEQLESFVNAIRGTAAPRVTTQEGIDATLVCLAMIESAREGGTTKLLD
jgi:predicted dehydrogenase